MGHIGQVKGIQALACRFTRGMPTLSLTVKSSSLLPCPESISTEGLMQTGGTGMCVMMRYSGRSATSSKMQSSAVMAENRANTRRGLKSSATYIIQTPCSGDDPMSAWSATMYRDAIQAGSEQACSTFCQSCHWSSCVVDMDMLDKAEKQCLVVSTLPWSHVA